jgi:hypothetical protein
MLRFSTSFETLCTTNVGNIISSSLSLINERVVVRVFSHDVRAWLDKNKTHPLEFLLPGYPNSFIPFSTCFVFSTLIKYY